MAYQIQIEKKALKFLSSVPKKDYIKLREHINQLAEDPHTPGSIKLLGSEDTYRLRYGNYRILYTVKNNEMLVSVIEIDHRKNIYR